MGQKSRVRARWLVRRPEEGLASISLVSRDHSSKARRHRALLAVALAAATGCGAILPDVGPLRATDDDAGTDAATPRVDAPAPEASSTESGAVDAAKTVWNVRVGPNGSHRFEPSDLTIARGDVVRWTWEADNHNVVSGTTSADGIFCSPNDASCSSARTSDRGTTYEHTFDAAGDFPYFCRPHRSNGMTATVRVR